MQKQEKLVSHLNNNEFVHNDNKSLFLAKKPQACTLKDLYELCKHFDLSLLIGMNFSCHDYKLQSTYDDLKTLL